MILFAALAAVLVSIALAISRTIVGPTVFDRLLVANTIGNAAILVVVLYGFLSGRPDFVDLALTYALLNYVGAFAVLKFFRGNALGADPGEEAP